MIAELLLRRRGGVGGRKLWIIIVFAVIILGAAGGVYFYINRERPEEQKQEVLTKVSVQSLNELAQEGEIVELGTIEPLKSAPLVARAGGRVTEIKADLGETVRVGEVVAEIDGRGVASVARAQVTSAQAALVAFDGIKEEALESADLAVEMAKINMDAAEQGRNLFLSQANKSREQADLAVRQAELNFEDQIESEDRRDELVRAADLALKSAELVQDQATIARQLASQQTEDALCQAETGLKTARQAKERTRAELESQRVGLLSQLNLAIEQVELQQVRSTVAGQIGKLDVKTGDFVVPGQVVGEVTAFEGARVTISVSEGVRLKLSSGQELEMKVGNETVYGRISGLADASSTDVPLWQVNIVITETDEPIHPGQLASVRLPVGPTASDKLFIPLDVITVRQEGAVLFTVNSEGVVEEKVVEVKGFAGDFVEGQVDLDKEALVVVDGNRTLRAGQRVEISS